MIDRDKHIGTVSEPRFVDVEAGFLKLFAKITGETDSIYFDDQAAREAGHRAIPMPPTYLFSLEMSAPARIGGLFDKENGIGVDLMRILHGEQGFTYHQQIYAGDRLTITTTTRDIYEKKDGALECVVQDMRFQNQEGLLCAEARWLILVRNG